MSFQECQQLSCTVTPVSDLNDYIIAKNRRFWRCANMHSPLLQKRYSIRLDMNSIGRWLGSWTKKLASLRSPIAVFYTSEIMLCWVSQCQNRGSYPYYMFGELPYMHDLPPSLDDLYATPMFFKRQICHEKALFTSSFFTNFLICGEDVGPIHL